MLFLSLPARPLASTCAAGHCRQGVNRAFSGAMVPAGAPAVTRKTVHRTHPTATNTTAWAGSSPGPQPTSPASVPTSTPTSPVPSPTTTPPTASPTSSPTPTSTPTPSSTRKPVQVSYTLVRKQKHSFQGKFTIVNNGSTAVNGWQLAVELPGDHFLSVWDGRFHADGDTLYIDPSSSQRTIAPGETLIENFIAGGSTTTPTGCTFNGSAC